MLRSGWVAEVKAGGNGVKVVPRVLFEEWSMNDYMELFGDPEKMDSLGDYIGRQLKVRCKTGHVIVTCDCVRYGFFSRSCNSKRRKAITCTGLFAFKIKNWACAVDVLKLQYPVLGSVA